MKVDSLLILPAAFGFFLVSCSEDNTPLIESRAAELSARIDQLGIKSRELAEKTKSLDAVDQQLTELEEQTRYKMQDLISRERVTRETIAKIDAEMAARVTRVKELEKQLDNYAATQAPIKKYTDERLAELVEKFKVPVNLTPKSEDKRAILVERAVATIEHLQEENAKLRAALGQQPPPVKPPGQ